jgi:hypothetical protein
MEPGAFLQTPALNRSCEPALAGTSSVVDNSHGGLRFVDIAKGRQALMRV